MMQIYPSISRAGLANKEFALAKVNIPSASDSLLFTLIETAFDLATGGAPLISAYHIYDEQVSAPSLSQNANIIASKGVVELLTNRTRHGSPWQLRYDPECGSPMC